jgi:hypothetical protein
MGSAGLASHALAGSAAASSTLSHRRCGVAPELGPRTLKFIMLRAATSDQASGFFAAVGTARAPPPAL